MNQYYLFIDSEASGLPVNWALPYSAEGNWPSAVQISWLIYDQDQKFIKKIDHYIKATDFHITASALEVHGLTPDFLNEHGYSRNEVMQLLADDLLQYQPTVIGHFIRLDYHILSADFYRAGITNPLHTLPVFCTMVASRDLTRNTTMRHLRLGELYRILFNRELENQHNALNDARATAESYFELLRTGQITGRDMDRQNADFNPLRYPAPTAKGCVIPVLLMLALIAILIIYSL